MAWCLVKHSDIFAFYFYLLRFTFTFTFYLYLYLYLQYSDICHTRLTIGLSSEGKLDRRH